VNTLSSTLKSAIVEMINTNNPGAAITAADITSLQVRPSA
jgi:hypothetical protein